MLACTIHCRHLMVWKVFGPKFIYEGITSYVTFAAILLGYLMIVKVHTSIDMLMNRIMLNKNAFKFAVDVGNGKPQQQVDVNKLLHQKMAKHLYKKGKTLHAD